MQNAPDIPEPGFAAEAGVTTSEWKLVVGYARQLGVAGTAAVVAYATAKVGLHWNVPPELLGAVVQLELAGAVAVVGYAISRGIRKRGTPAVTVAVAPAAVPAAAPAPAPPPGASVLPPA